MFDRRDPINSYLEPLNDHSGLPRCIFTSYVIGLMSISIPVYQAGIWSVPTETKCIDLLFGRRTMNKPRNK